MFRHWYRDLPAVRKLWMIVMESWQRGRLSNATIFREKQIFHWRFRLPSTNWLHLSGDLRVLFGNFAQKHLEENPSNSPNIVVRIIADINNNEVAPFAAPTQPSLFIPSSSITANFRHIFRGYKKHSWNLFLTKNFNRNSAQDRVALQK